MDQPFSLAMGPAVESCGQRARCAVLEAIEERRDVCRRSDRLERDSREFEARAWFIVSGINMVDCRDPEDGVSLDQVIAELVERFQGQAGGSFWWRRELTIIQDEKIIATITGDRSGQAVVTRFRCASS